MMSGRRPGRTRAAGRAPDQAPPGRGKGFLLRIRLAQGWTSRLSLGLLGVAALLLVAFTAVFVYFYVSYARMVESRLTGQVFQNTSRVFTAPRRIAVGQPMGSADLTAYLERAGYADAQVAGAVGRYRLAGSAVEVHPGPISHFGGRNALRVEFSGRQISRILSLPNRAPQSTAQLEPELLTNLFDSSREKRRLVSFDQLPRILVDAVRSAEDKRFFDHPGFDPIRVVGAAWVDLRRGTKAQGASTITMQVARSFFFSPERTWRRKLSELLMALQLEQRFSKRQIFELYANQVYLGNRGSFAIHGFGEAAQAYFGKDVRELSLGEAAFLAGIIRAPNRYSSPERNPERAAEARDRVLAQMVDNKAVAPEAAEAARRAGLRLVSGAFETSPAPYFVDMVKEHIEERFTDLDLSTQSFRIYTTLDPVLQRAAAEAVEIGMREVDQLLARRAERQRKQAPARGGRVEPVPEAQAALVALDPRTGEIKALVGGRNYGQSQLNRALARRQPGSVFKPFVFAAAFDNSVDGVQPVVTPATTVIDEPTTFFFDDQEYSPNNYGEAFYGPVTTREALVRSMNVATVKIAELIGYYRVVQVARQMGLEARIRPTPAVALGAYEMTPLDVAAGYTVFATGGWRAEPIFLRRVVNAAGQTLREQGPRTRPALDPRVAFLVTSLMQDVVNRGTGSGIRARGFSAPAAGKTGTSHDGWFAGFTSNLLCVVWVGFDDNRELGLSGAASAAPIWAEFMKRATTSPALLASLGYPAAFLPPEGVVATLIDPETLQVATSLCPLTRQEYFIAGTEPAEFCTRHGGHSITQVPPVSWLSGVFGGKRAEPAEPPAGAAPGPPPSASPEKRLAEPVATSSAPAAAAEPQKKKNLLQRAFGILGGSKKEKEKESPKPAQAKP